jgi:hypothetical protein
LPAEIRILATKKFDLLKSNPDHPSLKLKKIGNLWSIRIGLAYRALAVENEDCFIWVWIGTHDDYEKLIK